MGKCRQVVIRYLAIVNASRTIALTFATVAESGIHEILKVEWSVISDDRPHTKRVVLVVVVVVELARAKVHVPSVRRVVLGTRPTVSLRVRLENCNFVATLRYLPQIGTLPLLTFPLAHSCSS